jgi:hypothetical protein
MTKKQFIAVFTQLQGARATSLSAAEFTQRKQEILKKAGVSEQRMQQFVKSNVKNVTLLADVFDTISNRLAQPDSTRNRLLQPADTTTGKH